MKGLYIKLKGLLVLLTLISFQGCAPRITPYAGGSVMSNKDVKKTFQPILEFMDVKPGIAFADVGAASGALTVMMATLMDSTTVYIQDIDTTTLRQDNLDKIIDFYSKESQQDLRKKNKFEIVIGNTQHSNLPDHTIDVIYSNATMHVFDYPDSMLNDLKSKLKPSGTIFIRDSFKNDRGSKNYCSDPKCAKRLLTINEFMDIMKKSGFRLIKQSPDMSGYPVFGFALAE